MGNINYGYAGKAAFPCIMLQSAARLYHAKENGVNLSWISSYFDDPEDQKAINRGIDYYEKGYSK